MAKYTLSTATAKVMCDLYTKLGGGKLKFTGVDSVSPTPNATNEFAGTPLAQAFATFVVEPGSTSAVAPRSLRQLVDGDHVTLNLNPCNKCDSALFHCIGILNEIFASEFIVPNTEAAKICATGAPNTDGVEFCAVIRAGDKCLC